MLVRAVLACLLAATTLAGASGAEGKSPEKSSPPSSHPSPRMRSRNTVRFPLSLLRNQSRQIIRARSDCGSLRACTNTAAPCRDERKDHGYTVVIEVISAGRPPSPPLTDQPQDEGACSENAASRSASVGSCAGNNIAESDWSNESYDVGSSPPGYYSGPVIVAFALRSKEGHEHDECARGTCSHHKALQDYLQGPARARGDSESSFVVVPQPPATN